MKCHTPTELEERKSLPSSLLAMIFLQNTFLAGCYTLPPFLFFEAKLIGFSGYLPFTCYSHSMLKRERKQLRSFLHQNIPWATNHEQTATQKLEDTLAKLRHTGTLIGQECPTIEVNWQVDPRFASKRNLSGKTEKVINEHSFGIAYHQYACNNFTITIIYQRYKALKDISIN